MCQRFRGINTSFIFLLLLALAPFTSADFGVSGNIGTFQENQCINLVQTCSNCTYNNISSIVSPSSSIIVINKAMAKQSNQVFNYTFCAISGTGLYVISGFGDLNGNPEVWHQQLTIEPTAYGERNTTTFLILSLGAAIFLVIAFLFESKIFAFISGIMFLLTGVYSMSYGFSSITNNFTQMFSVVIIGIGMILSIASAYEFMEEMYGGESQEDSSDY